LQNLRLLGSPSFEVEAGRRIQDEVD
jgi:hypothetical protein